MYNSQLGEIVNAQRMTSSYLRYSTQLSTRHQLTIISLQKHWDQSISKPLRINNTFILLYGITQPMIQFEIPDQADLKTTIQKGLASQSPEQRRLCLNSILIYINENRTTLSQFIRSLPLQSQKGSFSYSSELLYQVVRRKKDLVLKEGQELQVIKYICDSSLNLSATLLALRTLQELLARRCSEVSFHMLFELLNSPKLHPPSHKQEVRLAAYQLIQLLTKHPQYINTPLLKTKFISMVIDSTFEQRDPRNIGKTFVLYHWIIVNLDLNLVEPYKETMFTNIEAYYPIDYIGDEDVNTKVTLEELNGQLDDCITLSIFGELCLELLQEKTATPPVGQFLPTIKKYILKNPSQIARVQNILLRFLQNEFLEDIESYSPVAECFQVLFKCSLGPGILSVHNYELLVQILSQTIETLLSSKSGFVITLIKMMTSNKLTRQITSTFVTYHLIINYKLYNSDNLAYLLGLVIVCLGNKVGSTEQQGQLLQLSMVDIFTTHPMHLKILVMKILITLGKTSQMGNIGSLVQPVLDLLRDENEDPIIRKSLLQFVLESSNGVLEYQLKMYTDELFKTASKGSLDGVEILVYYYLLTGSPKISLLLLKDSEVSDFVFEEIEGSVFRLKPDYVLSLLSSVDYNAIDRKYLSRFKQLVFRVTKHQELQEMIGGYLETRESVDSAFLEVFLPLVKIYNPNLARCGSSLNDDPVLKIRQLDPVSLAQLQSNGAYQSLMQVCRPSPQDNPTLRQFIFQKVYPRISLLPQISSQRQLLLFLILQQTPSSLLLSTIQSIIELIVSRIQDSSPEVTTVSLNILNEYFTQVPEDKYGRIVEAIKNVLAHGDKFGMDALSSACEVLGKMAGVGGQIKYRKEILNSLEGIMSHPKRKVRRVAAYSLNKWYYM